MLKSCIKEQQFKYVIEIWFVLPTDKIFLTVTLHLYYIHIDVFLDTNDLNIFNSDPTEVSMMVFHFVLVLCFLLILLKPTLLAWCL